MIGNFNHWFSQNWKKLVFLTVLVFIIYFNALGSDFVADDVPGILNNQEIGNFSWVLSQPLSFLRPFLYFLAYKISGFSPFLFRLPNLIFHLGSTGLIFLLLSRLINPRIGFFSAGLFAVHPILVESVAWISGGIHAQYSFFLFLSLLLYEKFLPRSTTESLRAYAPNPALAPRNNGIVLRGLSDKNQKFLAFSVLSFIFALLSSEKAIIFPLIILLFLLSFHFKNGWKFWPSLIPFWLIGLVFGTLYLGAIGPRLETLQSQFYQQPQAINPFLQIPIAITSYLQLIAFPKDLTLYHSEMAFGQGEYLIRLVVLLLFLGLTIWLFFKNRPLSFWPGLFIIGLLPMLTPLGVSSIVAERYVYFSSLGIFVLIALLLQKAEKIIRPKTVSIVFAIILALLSLRTIVRNFDWQNQDSLWLATAKISPSSPQNHNNLGDYYGRRGEYERAIEEFKKAIELQPNYGDAYHNLGNTYQQVGKIDLAIESYQRALQFNPRLWQSRQNLAAIYFSQEKFKEASEEIQKAIGISPTDPNLRLVSAIIYLKMGQKNEARAEFEKTLELDPENQRAKELLTSF